MLNNLLFTLRSLNIQDSSIRDCLNNIDKIEYQIEELKNRNDRRKEERNTKLEKELEEINKSLKDLIKDNPKKIINAIRNKIERGFGYSYSSTSFELFQNADDSLVELENILDSDIGIRCKFVLEWDEKFINILHWGRPINLASYPQADKQSAENSGYNQDLRKMLSFNTSDKNEQETGKFGLGFKSVHLLTQQPFVISDALRFVIHAGLIPYSLPRNNSEIDDDAIINNLQEELKKESPSHDIKDGTIIHLPIDQELKIDIEKEVIQDFYKYAGLLIIFAKRIRKCKLIGNSQIKELSWHPKTILGIDGIETGKICLYQQKQWKETKIIHFHLSLGNIIFELPSDLQKNVSLTEFPTFWVTAPTKENLDVRFIINANFDITTGRTSLDRNSANNRNLMKKIGKELGEKLIELFQLSKNDWPKLRQTLDINDDLGIYEFWQFIWQVLVTDWLSRDYIDTYSLLKTGLGDSLNGFGALTINCAVIPNELHGDAKQLVRLQDLRYYLKGLLTDATMFNKVLQWPHFQQKYPSNSPIQK